jgi:hypothetical protein
MAVQRRSHQKQVVETKKSLKHLFTLARMRLYPPQRVSSYSSLIKALRNNITGQATISFAVTPVGTVANIKIT